MRLHPSVYAQCAADGLTIAQTASRLRRNKSTVHRAAKHHGIKFAAGDMGRIPDYTAVKIGTNLYPSVKAAAEAEDITLSVIYTALRNGTPERIGSRKKKRSAQ